MYNFSRRVGLRRQHSAIDDEDDDIACPAKRMRIEEPTPVDHAKVEDTTTTTKHDDHKLVPTGRRSDNIVSRLMCIMWCIVCHELPHNVYQCQWGHIMCTDCFYHIMADATLRNERALCPSCRRIITLANVSHNLAVQQAIWEMPTICVNCKQEVDFKLLKNHQAEQCEQRITVCKFSFMGCPWEGVWIESTEHEANCEFPHKSADELLAAIESKEAKQRDETKNWHEAFQMLSGVYGYPMDVVLHFQWYKQLPTFCSPRLSVAGALWRLRVRLNDGMRNVLYASERKLSYNLITIKKLSRTLKIYFYATETESNDSVNIETKLYEHTFDENQMVSGYKQMKLMNNNDVNRLLAQKFFRIRFWMFFN